MRPLKVKRAHYPLCPSLNTMKYLTTFKHIKILFHLYMMALLNISLVEDIRGQPSWLLFFTFLGILILTKLTISFLKFIYVFFLRPAKDLKATYGSWAVVTGATDGIGKSLAFELAGKGLNLVLVGRNPSKLHQVSTNITKTNPTIQTKTFVADLGAEDLVDVGRRLCGFIEGLDVGILVNSAGIADPSPSFFHESDVESWLKMVNVNLVALTETARAVLPLMMKRGKGQRGAIVNIGSASTVTIPSYPLFAVYAATKEYVDQLSKSLHSEYKDEGIDVQCQAPSYVSTNLTAGVLPTKWYSFVLEPHPDKYARTAIRWIGYEPFCVPYLPHYLQWYLCQFVPNSVHYHVRLSANLAMMAEANKRLV